MKYLRNSFSKRSIAISFLIIFTQSLFAPEIANALTTGPYQQEYTSYEEPGGSDMVNMLTGDFSMSLPILEVPGPEGGFSLPLTYSAGIGTDAEASWCGLGFNINPGSIIRKINGFPDDANGQSQTINVKDAGVRGWDLNLFGIGHMGWTSQQGHYGNLSLLNIVNASWNDETTAVGVVGYNVQFGKENGFVQDGRQFVLGIATLLSWGMAAGAGAATAAAQSSATSASISAASTAALTKAIAIDAATSIGFSALGSLTASGSPPPSDGYWQYSQRKKNIFVGVGVIKKQRIWLDQTRVEDMYGTLFLGNAPVVTYPNDGPGANILLSNAGSSETLYSYAKTQGTANQGAASDINYMSTGNSSEYHIVNTPVILANDDFTVNMGGIAGAISPYRLEVGSVAMPREMTRNHHRLAPVRYYSNNPPYTGTSYKVPFIYEGSTNAYFHHVGGTSSVTSPTFHYGIGYAASGSLTYQLNDVVLKNERIKNSLSSIKKIPQGNYVEWISNEEIKASMTYPSKYIDFLSGGTGSTISSSSDRFYFRTSGNNNPFTTSTSNSFNNTAIPANSNFISSLSPGATVDLYLSIYSNSLDFSNGISSDYVEFKGVTVNTVSTSTNTFSVNNSLLAGYNGKIADIEIKVISSALPQYGLGAAKSIGAFCITSSNGTTYHFGLPVHDYDQYTYIKNVNDANKNSTIKRPNPFANNWLLTAVTGPDYVDRNANGIADEGDWGHWVKLNYGIHSSSYKWRVPFSGYQRSSDNQSDFFSHGRKQLIYLNSIETRSHVALFKKSVRSDGKDADNLVTALKLDEILLLSREHYKKLIKPVGDGGYGLADFSNKLNTIFNSSSLSAGAQAFVEKNVLKRIQFTYTYDLCTGVPNSSVAGGGKLTLTRVSVLGANNKKIIPDYKFEYGFNPSYNQNSWDGFGMYSPTGGGSTHDVPQTNADQNGSAWSISKVITPAGSEIFVQLERDDYSSVQEFVMYDGDATFDNWNTSVGSGQIMTLPMNNSKPGGGLFVETGDRVRIIGEAFYKCSNNSPYSLDIDVPEIWVTAASSTGISFGQPYMVLDQCSPQPQSMTITRYFGTVTKILKSKKGGNVRVASITHKDELGGENKIRYLYKNSNGTSSGVLSMAPDYVNVHGANPHILGYPSLPVLYGNVSVLTGKLSNDNDYHTKQVFEFETPLSAHHKITSNPILLNQNVLGLDYLTLFEWKIEDRTAKIGALKSIKVYGNSSTLVSSSTLTYTESLLNNGINNYQGIYSSGVLMVDRVIKGLMVHNKANRTTILKYPYAQKKTVNTKDGFSSESENLSWDFLTGIVDQRLEKSSLGLYVSTVTVPAYTIPAYAELGSKAVDVNNKNMLSQVAAVYTYKSNASGTQLGLIDANVQTWKSNWNNYRVYNASTQTYSDGEEGPAIWRKGPAYVWKGSPSKLQSDGTQTFLAADKYNFVSGASNPLWLKTGELERFDHFGMPLQSKDVTNPSVSIYSAVKMGYDSRTPIAQATNAKYNEIAFTGAEDKIPSIPFLGGEVAIGAGTIVTTPVHSGQKALSLSSGYGFVFKTTEATAGKAYRASVWANSTNGRIYYKVNNGTEVTPTPIISQAVNINGTNWYRIDLPISGTGITSAVLEVGVKSNSGTVVFDDFRFQPADAVMTCYVVNPLDYEFTIAPPTYSPAYSYILDNDNLFTKFEYNEKGELVKVYRESLTYGVKLVTESKRDYRRFYVNP